MPILAHVQEELFNGALECGHMGLVRHLLGKGAAKAERLFSEGLTPLYLAAQRGHADVCSADTGVVSLLSCVGRLS